MFVVVEELRAPVPAGGGEVVPEPRGPLLSAPQQRQQQHHRPTDDSLIGGVPCRHQTVAGCTDTTHLPRTQLANQGESYKHVLGWRAAG